MVESRPLVKRVSAPVAVAGVWVLSTLYLFLAQAQRIERPWGLVVTPSPRPGPGGQLDGRAWLALGIGAGLLLAACRLLVRRSVWATSAVWAVGALVASALVVNYDIHSSAIGPEQYLPVCVAVYFVVAGSESRRAVVGGVGLAFGGLLGYVWVCAVRGLGVDTPVELIVLLVLVLAVVMGNSQRRERLHAEQTRRQAAAQAVTAERLRIARELHDMVAHTIGVVALQAGAAKSVVMKRPEAASQALGIIEDAGRETLAGLRRMLGVLRDADAPSQGLDGLGGVERLVERAREAGLRVDVEWRGERRRLPAEVDLAAFRVVQESVTNVMKHSGARQCRVSVGFREDDVTVVVVDSGSGKAVAPGAGYGLTGMRERVELVRGDFSAGPRPEGGYRVVARIPVPGEA